MPDLINLRIFSNVLFFIGRALAGEDTIEAFTKRAKMYAGKCVCVRTRVRHKARTHAQRALR
jgi:hypothetical protein